MNKEEHLRTKWRSRTKVLGLIFAFALIAAACDDSDQVTTTVAPGTTAATTTRAAPTTTAAATKTEARPTKPYGGTVVIGEAQEPPTLNPLAPGGSNLIVNKIGQGYFVGVQEVDGFTLEFIPDVVTELPTIANGGVVVNDDGTMTVTYQIRDQAVWADGKPISGDDFQFTYELHVDPDLPTSKTGYRDIVSTEVGAKTFTYTLDAPTLQFELLFNTLIPKHDVEGSDFINDWNDTMWVSGGPFIFDTWQKGEFVRLVRNDNYWKTDPETGQQLPFLDGVEFRFFPSERALMEAFEDRDVDVITPPLSPPFSPRVVEELQALEVDGASIQVLSGPVWEHLTFQLGERRLSRNPNSLNEHLLYRQAVAHAVDKRRIVEEIVAGHVEPLDSYVEAYTPGLSVRSWAQYEHDPAQARALVTELCSVLERDCGTDPPYAVFTTTSSPDRVALAELLGDMFEEAGIGFEVQLEDQSLFFSATLQYGAWDLGEWAWFGRPGFADLVSMHNNFDPEGPPPEGLNYYRWGTPRVSGAEASGFNQSGSAVTDEHTARFAEIRDAMNSTVDEQHLRQLIQEAEGILAEQVVIIPLFAWPTVGAVWADEIDGYRHNPSRTGDTWNIESWYRADR